MKKILLFFLLTAILTSCYEDYIKDYDYSAVYFTYQTDVRSFIVGEGMKFKTGVALGGVMENTRNVNVSYTVDPSLITPAILSQMKSGLTYIKDAVTSVTALQVLPAGYYTLSESVNVVIKPGEHSGRLTITPDSAASFPPS